MAKGKMVYVRAKPKTTRGVAGLWASKIKYEAVCLWSAGVRLREISLQLNVPIDTLNNWRASGWWSDIHKEIMSEDSQQLDAKLTKILDKSLETIMDRLEKGEFVYDQKSGGVKRVPAKLRDATVAMNTVMDKRQLIRKEPTKIVADSSTATQLQNLATQFASFVNNNKKQEEKIVDVVDNFILGENVTLNEDGKYVIDEVEHGIS